MSKKFYLKQFSLAYVCSFHVKTVLFQAIQFCISTQFTSICPIDRILSGATTPGQSEPGSDGSEGVLHIPQNSSITGTSDCFVSNLGSYLSAVKQPVYFTAQANWAIYSASNLQSIKYMI